MYLRLHKPELTQLLNSAQFCKGSGEGIVFSILKEIVEIYNKRLVEVETDLSLLIEVR